MIDYEKYLVLKERKEEYNVLRLKLSSEEPETDAEIKEFAIKTYSVEKRLAVIKNCPSVTLTTQLEEIHREWDTENLDLDKIMKFIDADITFKEIEQKYNSGFLKKLTKYVLGGWD